MHWVPFSKTAKLKQQACLTNLRFETDTLTLHRTKTTLRSLEKCINKSKKKILNTLLPHLIDFNQTKCKHNIPGHQSSYQYIKKKNIALYSKQKVLNPLSLMDSTFKVCKSIPSKLKSLMEVDFSWCFSFFFSLNRTRPNLWTFYKLLNSVSNPLDLNQISTLSFLFIPSLLLDYISFYRLI
jgi:hypothetical protein